MTPGPHVALIGSMGSGKTTVGARVANLLDLAFHDNDDLLQRATGSTAEELERRVGMDGLHALEAEVVMAALAAEGPSVVTAAASTVEDDRCRAALRARSYTVWLRGAPSVLAERASGGSHRPLDVDVEVQLRVLAVRRDPLYAAVADLVVDVDEVDPDRAALLVAKAARSAGVTAAARP